MDLERGWKRGPLPGSFLSILGVVAATMLVEATDGMKLQSGRIHLAPRDYHMVIDKQQVLRLDHGPKQHFLIPYSSVPLPCMDNG